MKKKKPVLEPKDSKSQAYRVAVGTPRQLAEGWKRLARKLAADCGLDLGRVLDVFDDLASVRAYDGASWDDAQAAAWADTCAMLEPKAVKDAA